MARGKVEAREGRSPKGEVTVLGGVNKYGDGSIRE